MGRTSTRNFLTLFRAVGVDAAHRGPDVSDDVQLVYLADDIRQRTYIYAGAGTTEAAVIAESATVSLECRNPGGLEVLQITMSILIPSFGTVLHLHTSAVQPPMTGPNPLLSSLRTVGIAGGPGAPQSVATSGTIAIATVPTEAFRYLDAHGFTEPFLINIGQHFNVTFGLPNTAVTIGIMWRELRLFA